MKLKSSRNVTMCVSKFVFSFCTHTIICFSLVIIRCHALTRFPYSGGNHHHNIILERRGTLNTIFGVCGLTPILTAYPKDAIASNMPQSTGADLSKSGTVESLVPIVRIYNTLNDVESLISSFPKDSPLSDTTIDSMTREIVSIPKDEKLFKRVFDEYSDPISYKQKFMDQNAFLVYYTKGFDGPNRPSMENEIPKQTLQYGFRNDAWAAFDDFLVEISFAKTDRSSSSYDDISSPLSKVIKAIDSFLQTAPTGDLNEATLKASA